MQCPRYSHIRSNFFSNVKKQCKTFHYLIVLQFKWLLADSDDLVNLRLANFVNDCFKIHGK